MELLKAVERRLAARQVELDLGLARACAARARLGPASPVLYDVSTAHTITAADPLPDLHQALDRIHTNSMRTN